METAPPPLENMDTPDFKQDAIAVKEKAEAIQIKDQESYDAAAEVFKAVGELEKQIIAHYKPMKESAWTTHKRIVAAEKSVLDPVLEAKAKLSRAIGAFEEEERRKEEAERRRLEAEALAKLEEERLAEAVAAEEAGACQEEVEAVLTAPQAMPKIQVAPSHVRSSAVRTVTYYSAELKQPQGLEELVKKAAANPAAYLAYLLPNMQAANSIAKAQKELFNLPGFKLKKEVKAAGSGR